MTAIGGHVSPGFEPVRDAFQHNFDARREIGAAVAAYWRGEKVVDLWGGFRTLDRSAPWQEDTLVCVFSSTKGMSAMALALANSRGMFDYDAPVARYWPEFAQNGKGEITVRQLLGHEAGLVLLDEPLTIDRLGDLDDLAELLARQTPAWPPGTRHGYHAMTMGFYMQELFRRVDPGRRSLGQFFREEIAEPLELDFHIGLPPDIADTRVARLKTLTRWRALLALPSTPPTMILKMLQPNSLLRRSIILQDLDMNQRRCRAVELPAGNGIGTARSIAKTYSVFAEGGARLGITPETMEALTAIPTQADPIDAVIGLPACFHLGFLRPGPELAFGSSERAFGAPGAGGSFAFADPDAHLAFAYVMNKMDFYLADDPREKSLRDAVYRCIENRAGRPSA